MDESFPIPEEEPIELTEDERADIAADLGDLGQMFSIFSPQGVKGVVIACQECKQNHFYEWDLLADNLQHMLDTGEPRMHEPAWDIDETEYILWDYGKGFVDALVDNGIEPGREVGLTACPYCETPFDTAFRYCPACGKQLAVIRLFNELLDRGIEEREARTMLVRAGFEPF
jgi:Family of unknown function (DUF5319)